MNIEKLKELSKAKNLSASKQVLDIMRVQGCSSCCSLSSGGNAKEMK
ncbi:hypothetical protein NI389_03925 [Pseudoalteromonas xiamenensis]|nr:hypothetical protein [Pseudoalteromonas xiamenensis]WMN60561.1 hypothetical protein NI389_03925 [Pseudoalteromonas xiamenensis]